MLAASRSKIFKEIETMNEYDNETIPLLTANEEKMTEEKISEMKIALRHKEEVQKLMKSIHMNDSIQLLEFGQEPAMEISKLSDKILKSLGMTIVENSGELLKQLGRIMEKFNKKDFEQVPISPLGKLFKRGEKRLEKWFGKYQTMGREIDQMYIDISKYKNELIKFTRMLEELYDQNYQYYITLEKYIVAGEMKLEEIRKSELPRLEVKAASGDEMAKIELQTLKTGMELLKQRIHDLELAKMVALQTAPQIRLLQRGNTKLIGKINSAFVTTIPIFKNGLIQAIAAKRQKLVLDSMNELEKRTNEILLQNAQNISKQSAHIEKLSGCPSIKMETIEEAFHIIMKGMEETLSIEEENKRLRVEGSKKLKELQENFKRMKLNM